LEPLYEQQFLDASYGFRPGRSAHQALDALWQRIMPLSQCWLIGLDPAPSSGHCTSKGIERGSNHCLWSYVWVEDLVQPFDYPPQIV